MRAATLVVLLTGCTEYGLNSDGQGGDAGTEIEVYPQALMFGPARADDEVTETFEVRNVGDTTLEVSQIRLDAGMVAFSVDVEPFDLAMDESRDVEVSFTPVGDLTYGQITVVSNDFDEPEIPVFLEGLGQVPALEITPETHVFSTACDDAVVLTLQNVGLEDLEIFDMSYETAGSELSPGQRPVPAPDPGPRRVDPGDGPCPRRGQRRRLPRGGPGREQRSAGPQRRRAAGRGRRGRRDRDLRGPRQPHRRTSCSRWTTPAR